MYERLYVKLLETEMTQCQYVFLIESGANEPLSHTWCAGRDMSSSIVRQDLESPVMGEK